MKKYDEAKVIRALNKKGTVNIDTINKVVEVVKNATNLGNGSWGKIDYLCKVHGYIYVFTTAIANRKSINASNEDITYGNNKSAKREAKLNMASMTKNAMRNAKRK